jgi:transposase
MSNYIGLDVSMKQTSVCIVNKNGDIVFEKEVDTDPEVIFKCISETGLEIEIVGLESGSLTHWLVDGLTRLGLPAIAVCSRKMEAILSITINKTDKNDAKGIALAMRGGYYRKIHHKSQYAVELSTMMGARRSLVSQRTDCMNTIRGLMKTYGILIGIVGTTSFYLTLESLVKKIPKDAQIGINALLEAFKATNEQVIILDKKIEVIAMKDPIVLRLMTHPGVGPITALTFKMEIDDPKRFKKSRSVGAYIGVTPTQYSSGETHRQGKISKCGSSELRYLMGEAANSMMMGTKGWNKDKAWAFKIMKKQGYGKARTALSRKMAVKLHRMWLEEKDYQFVDITPEEVKIWEKYKKDRKKTKKQLEAEKAALALDVKIKRTQKKKEAA